MAGIRTLDLRVTSQILYHRATTVARPNFANIFFKVLRDKESGKSRAFGFVTFACTFMAEAALEATEHIINDRKIEPRLAEPDMKKMEMTERDYMLQMEEECRNKRSIFVAALKDSITEDDLVQYFSAFGKVVRAVKSMDKSTGVKKTFGFVDFADFGIVHKVVLCTKHYLQVRF